MPRPVNKERAESSTNSVGKLHIHMPKKKKIFFQMKLNSYLLHHIQKLTQNELKRRVSSCAAAESASAAAGDWRDVSHHLAGTAYQEARRQNLC